MEYALIRPREGAEHKPGTPGGAWAFQSGGQWHKILDDAGEPRPFEVGVAEIARRFFTPTDKDGEHECLVEIEFCTGDLEFRPAQPSAWACKIPGCSERYTDMGAYTQHIMAVHAKPAAPPPPPVKR